MFIERSDNYDISVFSVRDNLTGEELWSFTTAASIEQMLSMILTADDQYIITGRGSEKLRMWDVRTGILVREFC
jgi:hypothetical protein